MGIQQRSHQKGDEWKAAFITSMGLYEPLVMFFGLTNSPATFQHMMDDIFIKQVQDLTIIVYLDNILVFTDDLEKHRKVVNEVLALCRLHKLYLKLEKCQFEQTKIDFLGIVIEAGSVTMDPIKTKAVNDWPVPKTLRQVRSFMQFCNFYLQRSSQSSLVSQSHSTSSPRRTSHSHGDPGSKKPSPS